MLAAVFYANGEGAGLDAALAGVATTLRGAGVRLAGAVQFNTPRRDRCRCEMSLEDLATGRVVDISEDRGPLARGCRLNPSALETVVGLATAAVEQGADLLIVNKFGKHEIEGGGFRAVIAAAVDAGIPVLVAVGRDNAAAWQSFTDGGFTVLPAEIRRILAWCDHAMERDRSPRYDPTAHPASRC